MPKLFAISQHGLRYVGLSSYVSFISLTFSRYAFFFFAALSIFLLFFFRDPKRTVPLNDSLILSPSDGVVSSLDLVESPLGDGSLVTRVSVFLNIFNVHVNRSPVTGTVKSVKYRPGKLLNALTKKSITQNEMIRTVFESHVGNHTFVTEQLAGFICRRAVCDLTPGDDVKLGSRMGIIKFGSRVNLYLPPGVKPTVVKGQKVVAGETVFGYLDSDLQNTTENYNYQKF